MNASHNIYVGILLDFGVCVCVCVFVCVCVCVFWICYCCFFFVACFFLFFLSFFLSETAEGKWVYAAGFLSFLNNLCFHFFLIKSLDIPPLPTPHPSPLPPLFYHILQHHHHMIVNELFTYFTFVYEPVRVVVLETDRLSLWWDGEQTSVEMDYWGTCNSQLKRRK